MKKVEVYKQYKAILNSVFLKEYKNIRLGNVLAYHIWRLIDEKRGLKLFLKNLLNLVGICLFDTMKINYRYSPNSKILFVNVDRKRNDYQEIYDRARGAAFNASEILIQEHRIFSLRALKNIVYIFSTFRNLNFIQKLDEKLFFAVQLAKYKQLNNYIIENIHEKYNLVVTFCDAHPYENIIAQYFKIRNVATATLQHGQYMFSEDPDINSISYENFISDYLLSWGEFTNCQFIKAEVSPNRLITVGNAKYIGAQFETVDEALRRKDKGIFGLILEGPSYSFYKDSNAKLIQYANQLAKEAGLKYIIKLHPVDIEDNYIHLLDNEYFGGFCKKGLGIKKYTNRVDFSLIYVSSVYVELHILSSPVFRYKGEVKFSLSLTHEDEFRDYDELIKLYKKYQTDKRYWLENMKRICNKYVETQNIEQKYKLFLSQFN